jgi:hypothetical protein
MESKNQTTIEFFGKGVENRRSLTSTEFQLSKVGESERRPEKRGGEMDWHSN